MAKVFKGMSMDNFADKLVEMTNLNGHELYDYLVELINKKLVELPTVEKEPIIPEGSQVFYGNLKELRQWALMRGVPQDKVGWFGACAPEYVARIVAGELGLEWFMWERPVPTLQTANCALARYNPHTQRWDISIEFYKEDWPQIQKKLF